MLGTKWSARLAGPTAGCRYLDLPPRDTAQPGPAKRFRSSSHQSCWELGAQNSAVGSFENISAGSFQEQGLGFPPPPPSLLRFGNTMSLFLRFRKGISQGALHQRSGAVLKGGTRSLTPALLRDLLCLRKALRSALAPRPAEGNAAGSMDLFCR